MDMNFRVTDYTVVASMEVEGLTVSVTFEHKEGGRDRLGYAIKGPDGGFSVGTLSGETLMEMGEDLQSEVARKIGEDKAKEYLNDYILLISGLAITEHRVTPVIFVFSGDRSVQSS